MAAANACGLSPSGDPRKIDFQAPSFGDCNQVALVVDSNPIPTGVYFADTMSSTGMVPQSGFVLFKSAVEVNLQAEFNVQLGGVFEVQIANCDE